MGKVLLVTGGYDHSIRFWDVSSATVVKQIQYPDSPINLLRISPDRKWLAVAGNPHVRLFRNDSQAPGHTLQLDGHAGPVTGVAFSPDCAILYTGGEDKHIKIWDLRSGKCMHSLTCATAINGLSVHPSLPLLVAAELGGALSVWDLKTRQRLREIMLEEDVALRSCCFAPDASALVCGSNSGMCYVFRLQQTRKEQAQGDEGKAAGDSVKARQETAVTGEVVSDSKDDTKAEVVPAVPKPKDEPDGLIAVRDANAGGGGVAGGATTGHFVFGAQAGGALAADVEPLGAGVKAGPDAMRDGNPRGVGVGGGVGGGASIGCDVEREDEEDYSDGSCGGSESDDLTRATSPHALHDSTDNGLRPDGKGSAHAGVAALAIIDGQIGAEATQKDAATGGADVRDEDVGELAKPSVARQSDAASLISDTARKEAAASGIFWLDGFQVDMGVAPAFVVEAHKTYLLRCAVSPDSRLVATSSADHTAKVWKLTSTSMTLLHSLSGHQRWVWDMEFAADSGSIVTSSSDNSARSWNLKSGETLWVE